MCPIGRRCSGASTDDKPHHETRHEDPRPPRAGGPPLQTGKEGEEGPQHAQGVANLLVDGLVRPPTSDQPAAGGTPDEEAKGQQQRWEPRREPMSHAVSRTHSCDQGVTITDDHNDQITEPQPSGEAAFLAAYREVDEADRVLVWSAILTQ